MQDCPIILEVGDLVEVNGIKGTIVQMFLDKCKVEIQKENKEKLIVELYAIHRILKPKGA